MARGPSPAPWIAAAILTALAFAVGRFTRTDAPPPPPRARALGPEAPRPEPHPDDLRALRGCVGDLGALQARVDAECPALARAIGASMPVDGGTGRDAAEVSAEAARRAAFRKELVARTVGVTGSAGEWLAEYVCLVDVMRERAEREIAAVMEDPAASPDAVDEIIGDARQDLEAMLGDIEARLGPARYARLREIGGLPVLALACPAREGTEPDEVVPTDAGAPAPK